MEKAVLKTLIYANIFEFPLKAWEIHKWLIGRKATLRQIEKALGKLNHESKVMNKGGYYFLKKKESWVIKRKRKEKQSKIYLQKAKVVATFLKIIPWIKLVGISGGLAMDNADKKDDIDLFIITSCNRLWLSRILILGILEILGQRRKVSMNRKQAAGKICPNLILEEDKLRQKKGIYMAHEVLQMKILWQRDGVYQRYLEENQWAFKFLPNWVGEYSSRLPRLFVRQRRRSSVDFASLLESLAKKLQLKIMKKPQGQERIEEGKLYFHPEDYSQAILAAYKQGLDKNLRLK